MEFLTNNGADEKVINDKIIAFNQILKLIQNKNIINAQNRI